MALRARVRLKVGEARREQAVLWTDASSSPPCLAAVLRIGNKVVYTSWKVPNSLMSKMVQRLDNHIGILEAMAVNLGIETFSAVLQHKAPFIFVDNDGVLGGFLKGGSRPMDINLTVGRFWLRSAELDLAPYLARVTSKANLADGPTRGYLSLLRELGAVWMEPVVPDFFNDLWSIEAEIGKISFGDSQSSDYVSPFAL